MCLGMSETVRGLFMGRRARPDARLAGALRGGPHQGVLPPGQEGIPEVKGARQGAGAEDVRGVGQKELGEGSLRSADPGGLASMNWRGSKDRTKVLAPKCISGTKSA